MENTLLKEDWYMTGDIERVGEKEQKSKMKPANI